MVQRYLRTRYGRRWSPQTRAPRPPSSAASALSPSDGRALPLSISGRLLIFNPAAAAANQCACIGDLQECDGPQGRVRYAMLRHSHRTNKVQHYEGYMLGTKSIFDEESLPHGVRVAFRAVCPWIPPAPTAAAVAAAAPST